MISKSASQLVMDDQSENQANSSPDDTIGPSIELEQLSEYEGNQIDEKQHNQINIGFININGLPKLSKDPKNINIKCKLHKYNFDIFGFAETNCNWPLMATEDKWHERIRDWEFDKSKSVLAYNTTAVMKELHQPGGTLTMTIN